MMKQTPSRDLQTSQSPAAQRLAKHMTEGGFIVILALSVLLFCSLLTHEAHDATLNAGGQVGEFIAIVFYKTFGYCAYWLPIFIFYLAGSLLLEHRAFSSIHEATMALRAVGLVLFMMSGCGLVSLQISPNPDAGIQYAGGIVGQAVMMNLKHAFNVQGAVLILFAVFLVGVSWVTGLSWVAAIEWMGRMMFWLTHHVTRKLKQAYVWAKEVLPELVPEKLSNLEEMKTSESKPVFPQKTGQSTKETLAKFLPSLPTILQKDANIEQPVLAKKNPVLVKATTAVNDNLAETLPSLALLSPGNPKKLISTAKSQELEIQSRNVEQHLLDFGIQVKVVGVHPGPVITRFELQLAAGVKVSRLSALAKDLARFFIGDFGADCRNYSR